MTNLERYFHLAERGTSPGREILGGSTTFITMAYILVVNPAILAFAGFPPSATTVATALAAAFGCLLMGLYANRPLAVAPYMGENAFLAFGLAGLGITWQQRLGSVFVAGILFALISILGLRTWLARAISPSLKFSFAAGIGLFLVFLGLYESGIVTSFVTGIPAAALTSAGGILRAPDAPVKLGAIRSPDALLSIGTFLLIVVLTARRVRGAILIGIASSVAAGTALGRVSLAHLAPESPIGAVRRLAPVAFQLDIAGVLRFSFLPILLTLVLMSFFDTLGTLVATGAAGGLLDAEGNFPDIEKPMLVDSLSCVASSLIGTSTSGAYIESAAGIRDGARTGLASVVTGFLFLISLALLPLLSALQAARFAYGPALVAVGIAMTASLARIAWDDWTELAPALATVAMMVFTYNIANGVTTGLLLWPVLKAASGRVREVTPGSLVLAAVCLAYFAFGLPH